MKIKVQDFWQEIGTVFVNKKDVIVDMNEETDFIVLQKGTYIIVSQAEQGYDLYEIKTGKNVFFESSWIDEETEFDVFYMTPIDTVDLLIESINKKIIQLASEGWAPNKDYFDLSPLLINLQSLTHAYNVLKEMEKETKEQNTNDRSENT